MEHVGTVGHLNRINLHSGTVVSAARPYGHAACVLLPLPRENFLYHPKTFQSFVEIPLPLKTSFGMQNFENIGTEKT